MNVPEHCIVWSYKFLLSFILRCVLVPSRDIYHFTKIIWLHQNCEPARHGKRNTPPK